MPPIIVASSSTHSTVDRLQQIPLNFWLGLGAAVAILIMVVVGLRRLAHGNKAILTVIACFVASVIGFTWIYERNEPSWATPVVNFLSGYFPTKVHVEQRKAGL